MFLWESRRKEFASNKQRRANRICQDGNHLKRIVMRVLMCCCVCVRNCCECYIRLGVKGLEAMLKAKFSKMKDGVFTAEDDDM